MKGSIEGKMYRPSDHLSSQGHGRAIEDAESFFHMTSKQHSTNAEEAFADDIVWRSSETASKTYQSFPSGIRNRRAHCESETGWLF